MRISNYDKEPTRHIKEYSNQAWQEYESILQEIIKKIDRLNKDKITIVIDCYTGVDEDEVLTAFKEGLNPIKTINAHQANYDEKKISEMLKKNITDDRVFGLLSHHNIQEFFEEAIIRSMREEIQAIDHGIVLVYGVGASLITEGDILIYADLARWEIQKRMRREEIGNWCAQNKETEFLRKYKRAFFIDWRVVDRHKITLFDKVDYLLDTNTSGKPKMITGHAFLNGLKETVHQPFRVVPFFDPGPWGGQWMKRVCNLDKEAENYAWCFDCVPEENSLYLNYGEIRVEIPAIDLVLYQAKELLGDKVHARFGKEFPIRFDFLDTMEGGNLSLQVHPLVEYIQNIFGMHYTQDESYYLLDSGEEACVYLGLKENVNKDEMLGDLETAQSGEIVFDAERYVQKWPAKKHDHFLIPAGTVHCAGKNSMILEISATPYIFTFKLWDWERVGLDGRPRPIHIEHGKEVIQWDYTTDWTKENLINQVETIAEGNGWVEERTGLHEREFIETRRYWATEPTYHNTNGGVNVLNLIEGEEAIIESANQSFENFIVHYAETFIIPACVGAYIIRPWGKSAGKQIGLIKAFVRE